MRQTKRHHGFTLIELMTVVAIIAILGAVAVVVYQSYAERARAPDIITKYDAIRTGAHAKAQTAKTEDCAVLAQNLGNSNLASDYATLAYGFEAVSGGFRPVLTVCAQADPAHPLNVKVAREAHDVMARNGMVEKNAVVTDSVVSFALRLTADDQPLCKTAVPVTPLACATTQVQTLPPPRPDSRHPTTQTADTPLTKGSERSRANCVSSSPPSGTLSRDVMEFGSELSGYVMNDDNLATGGAIRNLSVEVSLLGQQQVGATDIHGATLLSYATQDHDNEFLIWDPDSIAITIKGDDYHTGINVNDGKAHRLTVTWDSAARVLSLYDNGQQVWSRPNVGGRPLGGFGKLVLGQDQDKFGGGFDTDDAYQGQLFSASLASVALTPDQIQSGPMGSALDGNKALITDIVFDGQRIVDTTGQNHYRARGATRILRRQVDAKLVMSSKCPGT